MKCPVYNIDSEICSHCKNGPQKQVSFADSKRMGFVFIPAPKYIPREKFLESIGSNRNGSFGKKLGRGK